MIDYCHFVLCQRTGFIGADYLSASESFYRGELPYYCISFRHFRDAYGEDDRNNGDQTFRNSCHRERYREHASWGVNADAATYFTTFVTSGGQAVIWTIVFTVATALICVGGVSGGIEKFCKVGMPLLFLILIIIIVKAALLPGAGAGFAFIFKPQWSALAGKSLITTLGSAGGQMFFSLSLGMGAMITYGSYLGKDNNLQNSSITVVFFDTLAALMAAWKCRAAAE